MKQQLIIISIFILFIANSCVEIDNNYNVVLKSNNSIISFNEKELMTICNIKSLNGGIDKNQKYLPNFYMYGTIITKGSKILMLSEFSNDTTLVFDFKLKEKTKTCIDLVLGQTNEKYITHCYYLTLDTIFDTKEKREKIYKFSWNNFSLYNIDNLEEGFIQFYYSDKRGIIGMNAGFYGEENKTDIIFNKGEQFDSLDIAKFIIQNPVIM